MKFKLTEKFEDDIQDAITGKDYILTGKILPEYVAKFNADIMQDAYGDNISETLDNIQSRHVHFLKHVLTSGENRNSANRSKYDSMSEDDYYAYACEVRDMNPTQIITSEMQLRDEISNIIDDFDINGSVLKIDYNLTNHADNSPIYAIFNKHSRYSRYMEICLVDKLTNQPVTIFPLVGGRFHRYMQDFLGID